MSSSRVRRSVCAAVAMAAVLGAAGCKKKADDAPDVAVAVKVAHPTRGAISEEMGADAMLAPLAQAAISPKISSPIREEFVQRGAHVVKGQLLMTLESGDLQGSAMDSKGSLSAAEATYTTSVNATIPEDVQKAELDLAQAKANYDVAARTATDRRKLFEQGALPGRDADLAEAAAVQARGAYETAEKHLASMSGTTHVASVKAAEGQLASAKGRYMSAEAQVGYASLRSPIAGVVTDRPLFPGETAVAGTAVITVMDVSSLLAKLHLAQATAQRLKVGGDAEVTVPGIEEPVEAKVSLISPALDAGSTTVEVWLKLANAEGKIKAGSSVHVMLHGAEVADALLVPTTALVPAQDGGTNVMVVGVDSVAHLRAVKVGIRTPETVQITDGLAVGDAVIVDGSYGLDEGTKVTIAAKAGGEDKD